MAIRPENATRLVQLVVWIGGVATTVAGTWIANKIRVSLGSREEMEGLLAFVDKLLETERPRTGELRSKAGAFHEEFGKICAELDYAIASRRPRGSCDLVTFF